jgi:electron transfer flavoprotein beta subunit
MVKIIVLVKQAIDVDVVKIDSKTGEPQLAGVPFKVSDMDKNAAEAAIQIREKNPGSTITALTVGGTKAEEAIKEVLAMGCDDAIICRDPAFDGSDSAAKALILEKAIRKIGQFDLIIGGEFAIDTLGGQVVPRLAERLDLPQLSYATALKVDGGKAVIEREGDEGVEVLEADLPAVASVTQEINQPRLPSLMAILQAGKKPMKVWNASELGVSATEVGKATARVKQLHNRAPKSERKAEVIQGDNLEKQVEELGRRLVKEGALK